MNRRSAAWAALLQVLLYTAGAAEEPSQGPLLASYTYLATEPNGTAQALIAPDAQVAAAPLAGAQPALAPTAEACSARCRAAPGCAWFVWCPNIGGCPTGASGTLPFHQCLLLEPNCTAPGASRGPSGSATAGFPVRRSQEALSAVYDEYLG